MCDLEDDVEAERPIGATPELVDSDASMTVLGLRLTRSMLSLKASVISLMRSSMAWYVPVPAPERSPTLALALGSGDGDPVLLDVPPKPLSPDAGLENSPSLPLSASIAPAPCCILVTTPIPSDAVLP